MEPEYAEEFETWFSQAGYDKFLFPLETYKKVIYTGWLAGRAKGYEMGQSAGIGITIKTLKERLGV